MPTKIFFVDVSNTYSWVSGVTAPPVALETLLQMYVSVEVVSSGCSTKNTGTYNILEIKFGMRRKTYGAKNYLH